jgi:hypothetical protein
MPRADEILYEPIPLPVLTCTQFTDSGEPCAAYVHTLPGLATARMWPPDKWIICPRCDRECYPGTCPSA